MIMRAREGRTGQRASQQGCVVKKLGFDRLQIFLRQKGQGLAVALDIADFQVEVGVTDDEVADFRVVFFLPRRAPAVQKARGLPRLKGGRVRRAACFSVRTGSFCQCPKRKNRGKR